MVRYAAKIGSQVCAEGVETLEDLYTLADLDVAEAQGWVVGMPSSEFEPVSAASHDTCASAFSRALASGSHGDVTTGPMPLQQLLGRLVDISDLDTLARA